MKQLNTYISYDDTMMKSFYDIHWPQKSSPDHLISPLSECEQSKPRKMKRLTVEGFNDLRVNVSGSLARSDIPWSWSWKNLENL